MAKRKIHFRITPLNIIFVMYLTILAVLSPLMMLPGFLLMLFGKLKIADRSINAVAGLYARSVFFVFRVKVHVKGLEHIPKTGNICFISNHQGLADIPLLVAYIPRTVGFIAKMELGKIPVLNIWMRAMHCVLIDRSNARSAVTTIHLAIETIQKGHPMVVFPEGTRSLSKAMGSFKPGSFKLITGANCLAVPVTINGTYRLIEATGKITPSDISLTIHPPINVQCWNKEEIAALPKHVENIIRSAL
jgi:1-acyl-sn-glycerol-3-phosphate acyltransferase